MDTMPKTIIVIPCYNEGDRIDVQEFIRFINDNSCFNFLFINDGSTDNTEDVIRGLNRLYPERFLVKNLSNNSGKAEAVRQGFLEAFKMNYEYIGFLDADLATPLSAINILCDYLKQEKISIVIGSRVRLLGRKIERNPIRHYIGRVFATFASFILDVPIYDSQCGAKIFKNNAHLKRVFSQPFWVKWIFDVEILGRFKLLNDNLEQCIIEYPLEAWRDIKGSKIKLKDFLKAPYELFKLWLLFRFPLYVRKFSPYSLNSFL